MSNTNKIKLVLVDDHQMFLEGLQLILNMIPDFEVKKAFSSPENVLQYLHKNEVDVVLTDIEMPNMSGIELTKRIKNHFPEVKVLVLTMHKEKSTISEVLLAEAEGYLLKNTSKAELERAINRVYGGYTYYCNEVIQLLKHREKDIESPEKQIIDKLTKREKEILILMMKEYTSKEIAEKLFISPYTVDTHRKRILAKTGAKTILGLFKLAYKSGLIEI